MRVLHIIAGLERGGAEAMLEKLIMSSRRCEHSVVSLGGLGVIGLGLREAGIKVDFLGLRSNLRSGLSGLPRLAGCIRRARPHLIQGWMGHGNFAATAGTVMSGLKVPLAWNVRQTLGAAHCDKQSTRVIIRLNAHLSGRADAIIYNSRTGMLDHEAIGYLSRKRRVIPNGFDVARFMPSTERRAKLRSELGLGENVTLVGLVGRYDPWKNHAAFFEAASRVVRLRPDVRFLFAGRGMALSNRVMLESIRDPHLLDNAFFIDDRPDIAEITSGFDIACNVSLGEGFSNAVGEAMASAVPCVVTDVGDSRWIVANTGVICNDTTAHGIAKGLLAMIDLGPDARAEMGRLARSRIERKFSLSTITSKYEDLYEQMTASFIKPIEDESA